MALACQKSTKVVLNCQESRLDPDFFVAYLVWNISFGQHAING